MFRANLYRDFACRPMTTKIALTEELFVAKWERGSLNDLLRKWLIDKSIPYFNDLSGRVWFKYKGAWNRASYDVDDHSNVTVTRIVYEEANYGQKNDPV